MLGCLATLVFAACGSTPPAGAEPASGNPAKPDPAAVDTTDTGPRWLKGQLHAHSDASGDSQTPPADVARWYAEHHYDFLVFTDHNRITEIEGPPGLLVFAGIELTQNLDHCEPPPEPGLACLLHVNGLFVGSDTSRLQAIVPPSQPERRALFGHALSATKALGGIAMLNHPNFHYAADADLLTALGGDGLRLFELANEAVDSNNEGDAAHPSVEANWDAVLTAGVRLYGVATDDAHHYYDAAAVRGRGELAHVGDRGWIMVRAQPGGAAIRAAIERGDFYSSNGVRLSRLDEAADGGAVKVAASGGEHTFEFIGDGGRVLDRHVGTEARWSRPDGYLGYVRVRVTDAAGHTAWTQPRWPKP